uniref:Uncharacterized protein n=1 Tax=Caenorhabditis tropicalis TaxID=1561998 RepID=A0A1I7TGH5_9PELO
MNRMTIIEKGCDPIAGGSPRNSYMKSPKPGDRRDLSHRLPRPYPPFSTVDDDRRGTDDPTTRNDATDS